MRGGMVETSPKTTQEPARRAALRPEPRTALRASGASSLRRRAAALTAGAILTALGGCGGALGPEIGAYRPSVIDAARLVQPPRPPEISAKDERGVEDAASAVAPERLAALAARNGAERFEGPQLPFFFESEIGRGYLKSGPGRAIARGAPAESCPLFGASLDAPDVQSAARAALGECLAQRTKANADCACRLLAADDVLLAERDDFAYARGVAVQAIPLNRRLQPAGPDAPLIAEERFQPRAELVEGRRLALASGARRLWLIGLAGPVAGLDLEADGAAALTVLEGARDQLKPVKRLEGRWSAEGYRRGRLAERVALSGVDGEKLVLILGYEPAEFEERREDLLRAARALF